MYHTKYNKYNKKIILLQEGGKKNKILFLFFNGGGSDEKTWYEHPLKGKEGWLDRENENKKSDLIKKIKKIGDVYLYTPMQQQG